MIPHTKGEYANPIAFVAIRPKKLMKIQLILQLLDGIILMLRLYNAEYVDHDAVYLIQYAHDWLYMMTSSNGNIFRVTGSLRGEFTGRQWRPVKRIIDVFVELRLNRRLRKQSWGWWLETPSRPLWRHCNEKHNKTQNLKHT